MDDYFTLISVAKNRKVQVTLEETQYETLARIAERDGKKMAAVVRESIERYCLAPESRQAKREALAELLSLSAPAPEDYRDWEREYAALKTEQERPKLGKGGKR
jgi:predicted DNA-binding protein